MCYSKRDLVIFFAGAAALHTLMHIVMFFTGTLPMHMCCITWTPQLNIVAIIVGAGVTAGLLWWAKKLESRR